MTRTPQKRRYRGGLRIGLTLLILTLACGGLYAGLQVVDDGLAAPPVHSQHDILRLQSKQPATLAGQRYQQMSVMGAIGAGLIPIPDVRGAEAAQVGTPVFVGDKVIGSADVIVHGPGGDVALQSETSIAANASGTILLAGYNEQRGFAVTPVSVSGISRSSDGGATWNEVPVGPGGLGVLPSVAGGTVLGDPEIKYDALNDRFIYASIFLRPSDGAQGMCIHISNSGPTAGTSWTGPIEVDSTFIAGAAADKEFMDVNAVTGRILMSWTNFPAGLAEIRTTFSDDSGANWSPGVIVGTDTGFVQSSVPRFDANTSNADSVAYVVWRTIDAAGLRNVGCSRSTDGGATWSPQTTLDLTRFATEDQILGNDRVNTSPSMDVDETTGRVYVVYQRNNTVGTGDIAMRTFTGPCVAGAPVLINSNPGSDREQWYPQVTVDQGSHNVHAIWLDQDPEASGDVTEAMYTRSTNNGTSWTPPTPVLDRPWHAGYGNDTSQPNLGDYNQNVAFSGAHYSVWGATSARPRYDEGQPTSTSMITPDTYFDKRLESDQVVQLRLSAFTVAEASCNLVGNGNLDPGETGRLSATLENYVANAVSGATTVTGITATLSTATPDVTVTAGGSAYPNIAPLATAANATPFEFTLGAGFVPGAKIDFILTVTSAQGTTQLPITVNTGTPGTTTAVITENFESVAAPALPAGWTSNIGGGPADPWVTAVAPLAGTAGNWAFHDNDGAATEFMRLFSPIVAIPAAAGESFVTLDFDIRYNTEDEPTQIIQAYDGLTLRITDQTAGATLRSILAEAFAEQILTNGFKHFPKHLPRNNNAAYFQDMSVWAGDSGGVLHVSMRFPGAGMAGRSVQLRFEYTEDSNGDCTLSGGTPPCGVAIDNIVMNLVELTGVSCPQAELSIVKNSSPDPVVAGQNLTYTLDVTNNGPSTATNVVVTDTLPAGVTFVSASGSGWTCGHAAGVVTCTRPSLPVGPAPTITIVVNVAPSTTGPLVNTATVTSDQGDAVAANSTSTESTVVTGGGVSVLEIPTLSTVGWIALVVLLAGASLITLRRRRTT